MADRLGGSRTVESATQSGVPGCPGLCRVFVASALPAAVLSEVSQMIKQSRLFFHQASRENADRATAYQPHIDGLRGISVLLILLFHLELPGVSGGFVGVDVFFVISGYLITGQLLSEIARQRFSYRRFFARRVRRLLPAFLVTLAATLVAGVFLLTPYRINELAESTLWAVFSLSNIYFWLHSGYFDATAAVKPLLHTWSLAVEEQFYVIWPALLVYLCRRGATRWALAVIGVLSFAAAELWLDLDPSASYLLTPFRVGEFAIGALLWWAPRAKEGVDRIRSILALLGLGLIGIAAVTFSEGTRFPGIHALVPCLGAVLLLRFGGSGLGKAVLVNPVLVRVGLVSYSLYLVHWPLIVFAKGGSAAPLSPPGQITLLITSIVVAVAMYRYVEQPFRVRSSTGYRLPDSAFAGFIGVISASLLFVAVVSAVSDGEWWQRGNPNALTVAQIDAGKAERFQLLIDLCEARGWERCEEPGQGVNVLILGDSHGPDGLNAMATAMPAARLALRSLPGCPPMLPETYARLRADHPGRTECIQFNETTWSEFPLSRFQHIVISVLFDWYTPTDLQQAIAAIKLRSTAEIWVFGNFLVLNGAFPELASRGALQSRDIKSFARFEDQLEAGAGDAYHFLSKRGLLCTGGDLDSCRLWFADVPFTYDEHHLSRQAATFIGERLRGSEKFPHE